MTYIKNLARNNHGTYMDLSFIHDFVMYGPFFLLPYIDPYLTSLIFPITSYIQT